MGCSFLSENECICVQNQAKKVLFEGGTGPPHVRLTKNGYDFSTNHLQSLHLPRVGSIV
jgi:hypothetical protein